MVSWHVDGTRGNSRKNIRQNSEGTLRRGVPSIGKVGAASVEPHLSPNSILHLAQPATLVVNLHILPVFVKGNNKLPDDKFQRWTPMKLMTSFKKYLLAASLSTT